MDDWRDELMNLDPTTLPSFAERPFGPHTLKRIPCGGVDRWTWDGGGLLDLQGLFAAIDAACDDAADRKLGGLR